MKSVFVKASTSLSDQDRKHQAADEGLTVAWVNPLNRLEIKSGFASVKEQSLADKN
jgi:hypothetical protein